MKDWQKITIIACSIVFVTILHFLTPLEQVVLHELYQRFYYIPIISAALLFGFRGGLFASVFASIVYLPHILIHWSHSHTYSINQYAETVIFVVVGVIMGMLGDRLKVARERAEQLAEDAAVHRGPAGGQAKRARGASVGGQIAVRRLCDSEG